MSIHAINSAFVRPCYAPTSKDHRAKKHHTPPYRPELRWFFGGLDPATEGKLVAMMNARRAS